MIVKRLLDKLEKAHATYESAKGSMESYLADKCEFGEELSVDYQPSDGFVIQYDSDNAPLDSCLDVIKEKGALSHDDFLYLCI